jgi:hypothetical protein
MLGSLVSEPGTERRPSRNPRPDILTMNWYGNVFHTKITRSGRLRLQRYDSKGIVAGTGHGFTSVVAAPNRVELN